MPLSEVENASEAVLAGEVPDSLPVFRSVHVAVEGDVWVEQWPPEGRADERFYDVYRPDGAYRGSVTLPASLVHDPPPYFTDGPVYGVVRDPETEVERVVTLTFTPEEEAR